VDHRRPNGEGLLDLQSPVAHCSGSRCPPRQSTFPHPLDTATWTMDTGGRDDEGRTVAAPLGRSGSGEGRGKESEREGEE
jgi:hypothetical protein